MLRAALKIKVKKNDNSYFGGCPNIANIILNNGANTD